MDARAIGPRCPFLSYGQKSGLSMQLSYGLSWEETWIEAKREGLKKQLKQNKILPVHQAKKKPHILVTPPTVLVSMYGWLR